LITFIRHEIEEGCKLVLHEELHSFGGMYYWSKHNENVEQVIVAYCSDEPVGSLIYLKEPTEAYDYPVNIGVFVKPDYRRNGIGTMLIQELMYMGYTDIKFWTKGPKDKIRHNFFTKAIGKVPV
jgi:GNAT superfamily N-acetyltransferase